MTTALGFFGAATGSTPPPASTYLDSLSPSPAAVYSLRKMVSTATKAVRVRRSSDNTEQDIGFTGNALDSGALLAFVGSGNGFVTTFYNQAGGGFDAVQATAASQPSIVSAGSYGGVVTFDGSNDALKVTALTMGNAQAGIYAKLNLGSVTSTNMVVESSTNYNNGSYAFAWYYNTGPAYGVGMSSATAGSTRATDFSMNLGSQAQISLLLNRAVTGDGQIMAYRNGAALAIYSRESTIDQVGTFGNNDVFIGGRAASSLFSNLVLETLVIYRSDTAASRGSIEAVIA